MKNITKNTPRFEVYTHTYKGIDVIVKIDYENAEISLMENETLNGIYQSPKKWVFAGRTPEYISGWVNILEAMKSAVLEAKQKVQLYESEREANKNKEQDEVLRHVALGGRKKK